MLGHKFITFSAVFVIILNLFFVANASMVIFSDGFESDFSNWTGNDPKWDISGGNVHGGTKRGEVKGNTEPGDDVLLKNISTLGYKGIVFEFWYKVKESLENDDHMYVEWTDDGSSWNILKDFTAVSTSSVWEFYSISLPVEADDSSNFAVRFRAHLGAVTSDIFYLDDVVVSAGSITSEPTPVPAPFTSSEPAGSPQATSTPESIPDSTPTPMATSTNSPQVTPVTPMPTPTPTLTLTPTPVPVSSSKPHSSTTAPTPIVISSPKINQLNQESSDVDEDLTAIPNFFDNSKFFWLIGAIVLMVVFSLSKLKSN